VPCPIGSSSRGREDRDAEWAHALWWCTAEGEGSSVRPFGENRSPPLSRPAAGHKQLQCGSRPGAELGPPVSTAKVGSWPRRSQRSNGAPAGHQRQNGPAAITSLAERDKPTQLRAIQKKPNSSSTPQSRDRRRQARLIPTARCQAQRSALPPEPDGAKSPRAGPRPPPPRPSLPATPPQRHANRSPGVDGAQRPQQRLPGRRDRGGTRRQGKLCSR